MIDCQSGLLEDKEPLSMGAQEVRKNQVMVHYHYPSVYLKRLETPNPFLAKIGLWEVFNRNGVPSSAAVELTR